MKRIQFFIVLVVLLSACAGAPQAQSTQTAPAGPGLERPSSFGLVPISGDKGFSVMGSASVKANQAQVKAEIDTVDLEKIRVGYRAAVTNPGKGVLSRGVVVGLPDPAAVAGSDTCQIDVLLADAAEEPPAATPTAVVQPTEDGNASAVMSVMVSSTGMGGLPAVDADVMVRIYLPVKENVLYVDNASIFDGKDGKKYVWASEKTIPEVSEKDLALVAVTTGASDGRVTEILSGLTAGGTVLLAFE